VNHDLTEYDKVIYPSYTHPQTHPARLHVIGALMGLEPAPADHCRVLELGCGDGTNLVPMAWALPGSEFRGVDLAAERIRHGQLMAQDLGLKNLQLVPGDLRHLDGEWGQFDYLIAHGLYSWVPLEVRDHMLRLCRRLLAPHGIAFVSYNALPGCHLRSMLREMMLFHVRGLAAADERIQQARALVQFLAEAQDSRDEYRLWMKAELQRVLDHAHGHLYHDELAEINEPVYFTQFMSHAARHDLQYLGEADYFEMSDHVFRDSVRETLRKLARNRLLREQYLDFLKCRRFRQTLLCRRDAELRTEPQPGKLAGFLVSSSAVCAPGSLDLTPGVNCVFETPKGAKCQTDLPLGKATLALLGETWPAPMPVRELSDRIRQRLADAGMQSEAEAASLADLCEFLMQLYEGGAVEFRSFLPPLARAASERPEACPVVRWEAAHRDFVTSLFHIAVRVEDELGRNLLTWLDGTTDRTALAEKLWAFLKAKQALVLGEGGETAARRELAAKLEENLAKLLKLGLLVR